MTLSGWGSWSGAATLLLFVSEETTHDNFGLSLIRSLANRATATDDG